MTAPASVEVQSRGRHRHRHRRPAGRVLEDDELHGDVGDLGGDEADGLAAVPGDPGADLVVLLHGAVAVSEGGETAHPHVADKENNEGRLKRVERCYSQATILPIFGFCSDFFLPQKTKILIPPPPIVQYCFRLFELKKGCMLLTHLGSLTQTSVMLEGTIPHPGGT